MPLAAGEESQYTAHEFYIASDETAAGPDRPRRRVSFRHAGRAEILRGRAVLGRRSRGPVASPEKTLADCADQPNHCGGVRELAKGIREGTDGYDPETLLEDVTRIGNGAALKRLVYPMDHYGVPVPDREAVTAEFTDGSSPLDPTRSATGTHAPGYRLYVTIPDEELP